MGAAKAGPSTGYFYKSVRVCGRVRKVYCGRGQAGHEAAAAVELSQHGRREAKRLLATERNPTDEADRLAADLRAWAGVLLSTWHPVRPPQEAGPVEEGEP